MFSPDIDPLTAKDDLPLTKAPTIENPVHRIRNAMRKMRLKKCVVCGKPFETDAPNGQTCRDICRDELADRRAAERKAKTGQKSGAGRPAVTAKLKARAIAIQEMEAAGIEPSEAVKRLPKELQLTAQAGIPHLKMTPERRQAYLGHLRMLGHAEAAAKATDGMDATGRVFRALALKDPQFAAEVRDALNAYGAMVHATAHKIAIEGILEPVVSMGEVIAHKRVYAEKTLQMLLKKHDAEMRAANAGAGGATVNVQINTGMQQGPQDVEPVATVTLSEVWRLPENLRDDFARVYEAVLQMRNQNNQPVKIDLTPPQEVLDLEATEIEVSDDDI